MKCLQIDLYRVVAIFKVCKNNAAIPCFACNRGHGEKSALCSAVFSEGANFGETQSSPPKVRNNINFIFLSFFDVAQIPGKTVWVTKLIFLTLFFPGLHCRPGLRARRGSEVSGAGRESWTRLRGERGSIPGHTLQQGEAHRTEGLHGIQANGVRVRPAQVRIKYMPYTWYCANKSSKLSVWHHPLMQQNQTFET